MKKVHTAFKSLIAMALGGLSRAANYFAAPVGSKKQVKVTNFPDAESGPVTRLVLMDSCEKHLGRGSFAMDSATLEEKFLQRLLEEDLETILPLQESTWRGGNLQIQIAIEADDIPPEGMKFIREFFYRDHD